MKLHVALLVLAPLVRAQEPSVVEKALQGLQESLRQPRQSTQVLDATFRLECKGSTGTGFILARPTTGRLQYILVSGAHDFTACRDRGNDTIGILMRRPTNNPQKWDLVVHRVTIANGKQPLWTTHPTADVAVIPVNIPEELIPVPLLTTTLADAAALQSLVTFARSVQAFGYPFGDLQQNGFALLRPGQISTRDWQPGEPFELSFSVFPGDSGGPVYVIDPNGHPILLGLIVRARIKEKLERAAPQREVWSLIGAGRVEQATRIQETIDLLPAPTVE